MTERAAERAALEELAADVIALVVLRRLRYRLSLRDLAEMFLVRGIVCTHGAGPALVPTSI